MYFLSDQLVDDVSKVGITALVILLLQRFQSINVSGK